MQIELPHLITTLWTPERDEELRRLHGTMSIKKLEKALGVTNGALRGRITKLGLSKQEYFPPALIEELSDAYGKAGPGGFVDLKGIAQRWGKSKANLCRKAKTLGLATNRSRQRVAERKVRLPKYETDEDRRAAQSDYMKRYIAEAGHPRGMAGKNHSADTRNHLSKTSAAWWNGLSPKERENRVNDNLKAAIAKNGRIGAIVSTRETTWKAGWREISGRRHYFRSRWEANYARYLQWLKERGEILEWEYEPETFWFEAIKRGVRSYLPDFRVHELNGSKHLHEVKGWMDARSKTTLKRMAKYHPKEKIILIREREYRAISRFSALIGGWE